MNGYPARRLALLLALLPALLLSAFWLPSVALAQAETPPPGSPLRREVLDALRPMVTAEIGAPVEFVVETLKVLGEWAFVQVRPQRPGGAPVGYAYSRYQGAVDNGVFDNQATALLRQTPDGWLVYEYNLGATDAVWMNWPALYPVPTEVFPF